MNWNLKRSDRDLFDVAAITVFAWQDLQTPRIISQDAHLQIEIRDQNHPNVK